MQFESFEERPKSVPFRQRLHRKLTRLQTQILQDEFKKTLYIDHKRRHQLAAELGITYHQVKVWFQNRRFYMKKRLNDSRVALLKTRQGPREKTVPSPSPPPQEMSAAPLKSHLPPNFSFYNPWECANVYSHLHKSNSSGGIVLVPEKTTNVSSAPQEGNPEWDRLIEDALGFLDDSEASSPRLGDDENWFLENQTFTFD